MDGLREDLIRDEGWVAHVYKDSMGYDTIGVGHLVDEKKGGELPYHIIDALLTSDIERVESQLDVHLPWWRKQPENVQRALGNMVFQLGINGLKGFPKMLMLLMAGEYEEAQAEGLNSKWAREDSPERAKRVTDLFVQHLQEKTT